MKYDGKKWLQVLVVNEDETINKWSIRQLYSDARNIWVVSDKIVNQELEKSLLQTYDGFIWKKVSKIPENDRIVDVELDLYFGKAYVATLNNGCYQVRIR